MTYPIYTEEIFIRTKNFLRIPSTVNLVLSRRVSERPFFLENLQEVLALRISKYCLYLTNMFSSKGNGIPVVGFTCLMMTPISLSIVKILYAS